MKYLIPLLSLFLFIPFQLKFTDFKTNYPDKINSLKNSALQDIAFLSVGLRRIGADIALINLMHYYAEPEKGSQVIVHNCNHQHTHKNAEECDEHEQEHKNEKPALTKENLKFREYTVYGMGQYFHSNFDGGIYPEMLDRAKHILSLDPYFKYAVLYTAGALAFNLNRADEAIEILKIARKYSPKYTDYNLYIAAIGFSKIKQPEKAAVLLDDIIDEPDTPAMLKNITAFLNKEIGRYHRAYKIYNDILKTSKDKKYTEIAKRQLKELQKKI